jgi:acyl carrier protein
MWRNVCRWVINSDIEEKVLEKFKPLSQIQDISISFKQQNIDPIDVIEAIIDLEDQLSLPLSEFQVLNINSISELLHAFEACKESKET